MKFVVKPEIIVRFMVNQGWAIVSCVNLKCLCACRSSKNADQSDSKPDNHVIIISE